ncbi:putative selenate reductase subunit YgfK [Clostridium sp. Marseille-P2415]|uniref:putative selenate reductase subunit YgfK n=1 Tax=Clostridium sp. Marseille-P2415 TaxID=1805471 RepID=UPI000988603D|nr:putative selenate reductase subunit YgfK [Clostridium sp. Marseille-P2415]
MGDRMTPMPFEQLMDWIIREYEKRETVFGVYRPYKADGRNNRKIFGRTLETPIGPAAGPHTQLAQNIVAAYYAGSRFFELKTVQILDGEDLPVSKPCIRADDECYNCEWSTELYVLQAQEEYIKAWFLLHIIAREYGLGAMDGFQFNMSVGYDLEGIKSPKVNSFINSMKDAKNTEVFKACRKYLLDHRDRFRNMTREDIENIPSGICNSVTLSTLHGCPPQEIRRIAAYLIEEKGLNTFVKCNPTLLGYEFARKTMDEMGYDYVAFGDFHFLDDLQYKDAVPMLESLMALAEEKHLEFGVKITNTFPVDVKNNELPSEEMYMSGKSLYPLSITLAARLAGEFAGKLRISFSGGADYHNIKAIVDAGVWPVTVATTLLKPGGYQRLLQMAEKLEEGPVEFTGVDPEKTAKLAEDSVYDPRHRKAVKPLPSRKMAKSVPLIDCYVAPCKEGCPIHQDITTYLQLSGAGRYEEAMKVIAEKNPLPFITGTICAHNCMSKCNRNYYEDPVNIRGVKLVCAEGGYDALMKEIKAGKLTGKKTAIVGGGPAGLAAAYFLTKNGMPATIFEKSGSLGGVVKHVIPAFRIPDEAIDKDVALSLAYGAEVRLNTEVTSLEELKKEGFDYIILAAGASKPGVLELKAGNAMNALDFLAQFKEKAGKVNIGKNVAVIGGGNTAMDTARAVKRTEGVEHSYLVYRRTKRYMPADEEELVMALEDGVEFMELLSPVEFKEGKLLCKLMKLSDTDAAGRRGIVETGETVEIPADTVIAAVGEQVPAEFYEANGIPVNSRGRVLVNEETLETGVTGVYAIGDGLYGPGTVVEAMRDARMAAEAILGKKAAVDFDDTAEDLCGLYDRRGILEGTREYKEEGSRCLGCSNICENCAEVCPNRANLALRIPGLSMHQIVHVDSMCNECGNCKSFCPYDSAPYLDKLTLFANEADMENSKNQGFVVLDKETAACKVRYLGNLYTWKAGEPGSVIPKDLGKIMETVCRDYDYLLG